MQKWKVFDEMLKWKLSFDQLFHEILEWDKLLFMQWKKLRQVYICKNK